MKKLIILSVFALGFGMSLNAQSDGFFAYNSYEELNRQEIQGNSDWGVMPSMLGHGIKYDMDAPLGSGLLLLAGMGLAYGMRKKSK